MSVFQKRFVILSVSAGGFHFAITFPPEKTISAIPDFCASNISLWDALETLCKIAKPAYKFEISYGGVIVVEPKSAPSD